MFCIFNRLIDRRPLSTGALPSSRITEGHGIYLQNILILHLNRLIGRHPNDITQSHGREAGQRSTLWNPLQRGKKFRCEIVPADKHENLQIIRVTSPIPKRVRLLLLRTPLRGSIKFLSDTLQS